MKCWLKSLNSKYPSVELKDKIKLTVGRSPDTKVQDSKVSRAQIEATANFSKKSVLVKQIGPNDSGLNGEAIRIGLDCAAKAGDILNLVLSGDYKYKVTFEAESDDVEASGTQKPTKIPKMFGQKSVADEFRKDVTLPSGNWEAIQGNDLLIYAIGNEILDSKPNAAAFDMDGTIIGTKSGRVFPKDTSDWKFLRPDTVSKLRAFFTQNPDFKFVLFTNQNVLKQAKDIPPFKKKIETILQEIGIPALVFIATKKDKFRKPMTGSWDVFVRQFNEQVEPDRDHSFYVGDAAGRKKDHSKADRLFALNLGLKFHTPEEYFQGLKGQEYSMPVFNPAHFVQESKNSSNDHIEFPDKQEMIIMVGMPASGKSTFVKSIILPKSYVHINCDTLKTMAKCISAAETALRNGEKVVIDNTNPAKTNREEFIKLAKKHIVPVRCFKMASEPSLCFHNNKFRYLVGDKDELIPEVAFNSYKSKFFEPSVEEGFSEIVPVFVIANFRDESRKKLYSKYLLEK